MEQLHTEGLPRHPGVHMTQIKTSKGDTEGGRGVSGGHGRYPNTSEAGG